MLLLAGVLLRSGIRQHAGRITEARSILEQGLSKAPESAALLNALGSLEQDRGKYFEAEQAYIRALRAPVQNMSDLQRILYPEQLGYALPRE